MSQFYLTPPGGTPAIPTTFLGDTGAGATAVANIMNIVGGPGVSVDTSGNTITINESGDLSGTASTVGAQIQTLITIPITTNKSFSLSCLITAYDSANQLTTGGQVIAAGRNDAGVVTVVGVPDVTEFTDVALAPASMNVVASGANALVQVTGVAGHNLSWYGVVSYIILP